MILIKKTNYRDNAIELNPRLTNFCEQVTRLIGFYDHQITILLYIDFSGINHHRFISRSINNAFRWHLGS